MAKVPAASIAKVGERYFWAMWNEGVDEWGTVDGAPDHHGYAQDKDSAHDACSKRSKGTYQWIDASPARRAAKELLAAPKRKRR